MWEVISVFLSQFCPGNVSVDPTPTVDVEDSAKFG